MRYLRGAEARGFIAMWRVPMFFAVNTSDALDPTMIYQRALPATVLDATMDPMRVRVELSNDTYVLHRDYR